MILKPPWRSRINETRPNIFTDHGEHAHIKRGGDDSAMEGATDSYGAVAGRGAFESGR